MTLPADEQFKRLEAAYGDARTTIADQDAEIERLRTEVAARGAEIDYASAQIAAMGTVTSEPRT